ncbi:hypothetical protein ACJ5NV_05165 [Loktanella agnita]|uniref:hypothetical protein n=1 Tax=Loktanella agnita TaxID=287097 RepID=UPI00398696B3
MVDPYVQRVAGELADLALADQKRTGDIAITDQIGEILGASSQTLQESFLTAVRVRRAEERARALLSERAGKPVVPDAELIEDQRAAAPKPEVEEAEIAPEPKPEPEPESQPEPEKPSGMPRRVVR